MIRTRAADYGQPRVRVRRLPDRKGWLFKHAWFEVEFTPVGADVPEWTVQTAQPSKVIQPYLPGTEGYAVIHNASVRWTGGVGPWSSLYVADEVDGADEPDAADEDDTR